ncbi:MAG TPA: serine hydrolase [Phenylobacterium sp.]|uniref:serine hydrolase n=1 Tax=Phenylobacterium sp. TaxID=1871053 RepID=UPI002BF4537A|nr:serine hydrolase [Phenylobacterium sp.]HSV02762.1 serine hydrolase [Phenylobacterium sp.]
MAITRREVTLGAAAGAAAMKARAQTSAAWVTPDSEAIRRILVERIDIQKDGVAAVVGVVEAKGRRFVSYGPRMKGVPGQVGPDTIFEIGSMTKVFTSLLLAIAVQKGEVSLDEPIQKLLPPSVHAPERNGRQITLIDLATHTSGLPRLPTNFKPKDPLNPYADYTVEDLYAFLTSYQLGREPGAKYEYSNLGGGLLGHLLARRAGGDYETLVRTRIAGPLGMTSTAITLTPALKARMAQGYTAALEPTPNWDLPTLAGAGALRSSAADIATFLAAELGFEPTPLKAAMAAQLAPRRPGPAPNMQTALAWLISSVNGRQIVWHNGGTGGFRTFMGFDPQARVGVVVMTNAATSRGGDDIGLHLLSGYPLLPAPPPRSAHHQITLPPEALQAFVGQYDFAPAASVFITRDGAQLFAQLTGQGKAPIFPEGANAFFYKVVDAQLTFERGADGRVTGLVLHQSGRNLPAVRVGP